MSAPRGKKPKAAQGPRLRWKFDDGSEMVQPIEDYEASMQACHHVLANSDNPLTRVEARQAIKAAAEQALKGRRSSQAHSLAGQAPRTVTEAMRKSIRKKYAARVAAGEVYGAVREIAAEFLVSETTLHKLVDDLKPRKTAR